MHRINNNSEKWYFLKIPGLWGNWTCSLLDHSSNIEKYDFENFYYNSQSQKNIIIKPHDEWQDVEITNKNTIQQCVHDNDLIWYLWCQFEKNDQERFKISVDNLIEELITHYSDRNKLHHTWIYNSVLRSRKTIEHYKENLSDFGQLLISIYYNYSFKFAPLTLTITTPLIDHDNIIFSYEYSNKQKLFNKLSKFVDKERFDERYDILLTTNNKYLNLYKSYLEKLNEGKPLNILEQAFSHRVLYNLGIYQLVNLSDNDDENSSMLEKNKSLILEWASEDYHSRYF